MCGSERRLGGVDGAGAVAGPAGDLCGLAFQVDGDSVGGEFEGGAGFDVLAEVGVSGQAVAGDGDAASLGQAVAGELDQVASSVDPDDGLGGVDPFVAVAVVAAVVGDDGEVGDEFAGVRDAGFGVFGEVAGDHDGDVAGHDGFLLAGYRGLGRLPVVRWTEDAVAGHARSRQGCHGAVSLEYSVWQLNW